MCVLLHGGVAQCWAGERSDVVKEEQVEEVEVSSDDAAAAGAVAVGDTKRSF